MSATTADMSNAMAPSQRLAFEDRSFESSSGTGQPGVETGEDTSVRFVPRGASPKRARPAIVRTPRSAPILSPPATDRRVLRDRAERALSRASGGPLVPGNAVRVLRNASENYPAWLEALGTASRRVCFENYIFSDDA